MSQEYKKFQPTQFKKIDFWAYHVKAIGFGISLDCWSISIQVPFFVIELAYYTKKEMAELQSIANYFSKNATVVDGEGDKHRSIDLES